MAYEPRAVPSVEEPIKQSYWYCLDCGKRVFMRHDIVSHWKAEHGGQMEAPLEGVDIVIGSQLLTMKIRREAWAEEQARRFADELHEGFTPADFLAEAEIRTREEVPVSPLEEVQDAGSEPEA